MTNFHTLNIGLMAGDTEITVQAALNAMRRAGICWDGFDVWQSGTEPTLVVECHCNDWQVDLVAQSLEQDCIAVWDWYHDEGRMVGPRKELWGEFDGSQFIQLNGRRLQGEAA